MLKLNTLLLPLAVASIGLPTAHAHEFTLGGLRVAHPHARPSLPGQRNGSVYVGLENSGMASDRLVGVSTPAATAAEIHSMSLENNVMKMREVRVIDMAAGTKLTMVPGNGYHIMLMNLKQPLLPGDRFPMSLVFEKAGTLEVSVTVDKPASEEAPASHSH